MKRNRGENPKTESHEGGTKKRRNKNDASQSLALPEQLSENRRDLLSDNLSSSLSAASNSKLEPGAADSLSMTDNELLLADPNSEQTDDHDLVDYVSYLDNFLSSTDLDEFVSFLDNVIPSADQAPSTAAAVAVAASNSKPLPKLANSGSMVKNDPLLADPHPLASTSSSVQLQPQQTERELVEQFLFSDDTTQPPNLANSACTVENDALSVYPHPVPATNTSAQLQHQQPEHLSWTSGGLLPDHLSWSELFHQLSHDSASSSAPNNYTVEVTDHESRTIRFGITHRSSLEEVRTEVTRRFNIVEPPFLINADTNAADFGIMLNDSDLRNAIELATRSGSRLIQLKAYKFAYPYPDQLQLQSQQTDHQNLTRGGLLQEQVHLDMVKQLQLSNDSYLANSASVVENDTLSIHPHPVAATSTSVQLQPEQLSSTSRGLQLPEHLDWSELRQFSDGSASSSAQNNYTVEATDKDSRTIRFEITHRSSLEEVRTEIARRFGMERLSFWMENADGISAELRVMLNDSDISKVISQATRSGSRLIRLKVYKFK